MVCSQPPQIREITVVFIGRSGAGKSTLRENILNEQSGERQATCKYGVALKVYDTGPDKSLETLSGGLVDLVILCIPVSPGATFMDQTPDIMRKLQEVFGEDIWKHCIIALTFSNVAWERCKKKGRAPMEEYKTYIGAYASRIQEQLNKIGVSDVLVTTPFSQQPSDEHKFQVVAIPVGDEVNDNTLPGVQLKEGMSWRDLFLQEVIENCTKVDLQNYLSSLPIRKPDTTPLPLGAAATIGTWVCGGLLGALAGIDLGPVGLALIGVLGVLAGWFATILFNRRRQ